MCRVFQERLHHPWGLGLPEKNYHFRFTNDFSAIFILFYPSDDQMCDTVEDGETRKPAENSLVFITGAQQCQAKTVLSPAAELLGHLGYY